MLATARKFGVRFSITARQDKRIKAAIEAIPDDAWTPIPYWLSTPEVSGADVAETPYTAFAGTKDAVQVRLVVRRVRPTPGTQLALFTAWDYHAMVTDRDGELLEAEADHRRHAVVEQSIAELNSAGLAHLPSGVFFANAAWLALAVIAPNLGRAVGALAEMPRATIATLRRRLFTIPARLVHTARRLHLHPHRGPLPGRGSGMGVVKGPPGALSGEGLPARDGDPPDELPYVRPLNGVTHTPVARAHRGILQTLRYDE